MTRWSTFSALVALLLAGCQSPYASDRLAAGGALLGAGAGAIIGNQSGHAAEGALIGAALGTGAGAITGNAIDESEVRNQAIIQSRLGRALPHGGVSIDDVMAMTAAGIDESVIVSQIENRGMLRPVGTGDLIAMQQAGVTPAVMRAAQRPRVPVVAGPLPPRPAAVIIDAPPYHCHPYRPHCHHFHRHRRPHVGVGFSYHSK